jgi:hypothetical protein
MTLRIPPLPTTLVANSAVQGIISVWHLNSSFPIKDAGSIKQEGQVENIWRRKIPCPVCCGETGWEGEKGVGSIPAIQCKAEKVGKVVGCEIRNMGEAVHIGSAVVTTIRWQQQKREQNEPWNPSTPPPPISTQYRPPSTQPYPGTPPSMVSALYSILAASTSSKNQKGGVWVPGVMKGASISKRIQGGAERELLGGWRCWWWCWAVLWRERGGRIAAIPMFVFEFFFVDTGEEPVDNVRDLHIFQRIISEDVIWIWEREDGTSHMDESKNIEEIYTFSSGKSVLGRIKLRSSTMGLEVNGLRYLQPKRSWA